MSKYKYLSEMEDCVDLVNFLLETDNRYLIVYYHELGPVTTLRYKGNCFYVKYNREHFARITMDRNAATDSYDSSILYELGEKISKMIGNPIVYYEMSFEQNGIEKMNPTLEWCLDKEVVDDYIKDVVNDRIYDDGTKCVNVKVLNGKSIKDYKEGPQLLLKR